MALTNYLIVAEGYPSGRRVQSELVESALQQAVLAAVGPGTRPRQDASWNCCLRDSPGRRPRGRQFPFQVARPSRNREMPREHARSSDGFEGVSRFPWWRMPSCSPDLLDLRAGTGPTR